MKVNVRINYTEMVTLPRCRKALPVRFESDEQVTIREVEESRAPVAFIVHEFNQEQRIVRMYGGKLYRQYQYRRQDFKECQPGAKIMVNQKACAQNTYDWSRIFSLSCFYDQTKAKVINVLRHAEKQYIIVDGYIYERTGEPYYYIQTFGFGKNHGGTGLFVGWANAFHYRYSIYGMMADNKSAAIERAVEVALNRGDTDSVDIIKNNSYNIEVFMPDAIKRRYKKYYC